MKNESSGYTAPKVVEVRDLAGTLTDRVTSIVAHAEAVLN